MDHLRPLERAISRRDRNLRGIRTAGVTLAIVAGALLAASIVARCAAVHLATPVWVGALIAVGIAVALGGVAGRARKPDLPRLLLSVDLALGTGERLSSLHELRGRSASRAIEKRIEERLAESPPAWRRALRVGRTEILLWAVGGAALAVALALSASLPPPRTSSSALPDVLTAAAGGEATPAPPASEAARSSVTDGAPPTGASGAAAPGQAMASQPLVDVLAELLPTPASRSLGGPTEGALQDEARSAGGSSEGLSDVLDRISRRGQGAGQQQLDLTEQEREALRDLAEGLPDSPLRDAILRILSEEDGEAVGDRVAEAQRLLGGDDAPESQEGAGTVATKPDDEAPQGTGETDGEAVGDRVAEAQRLLGGDDGADAPESQEGAGTVATKPDDEAPQGTGETDGAAPADAPADDGSGSRGEQAETGQALGSSGAQDGSPSSAGDGAGRAARSAQDEATRPERLGLVPEELVGEWAASGDVYQFMTKGLPFEAPSTGETATSGPLTLDVETLRSLLETRALASDLQDVVRLYFETITRGEP